MIKAQAPARYGWIFAAGSLLAWSAGVSAQQDPVWQPWQSPAAMARLDPAMTSIEVSSFCSGNCRYDRSGGGGEPAGNPHPDRWLYRDGADFVLFDDPGSGVLTRIWLTSGGPTPDCLNPAMRFKLYFGTADVPQLDMPLAQVFDGSAPPFTAPLVFDRNSGSGGYVSYVPIAYSEGLRVAVTALDQPGPCSGSTPPLLWYQLDAQRLPPGSVTSDFNPANPHATLRTFLAAEGTDPWQRGLPMTALDTVLQPGQSLTLASGSGAGWLAGIRLNMAPEARDRVRIEVDIDAATPVSMPVSRAFLVDTADSPPARSPLFGEDGAGWLYLWWPMPHRQHYAVRLMADGLDSDLAVQARVSQQTLPVPVDAGVLHGAARVQCGTGIDHQLTLLEQKGSGRLVALGGAFAAANGPDPRYLEGDVRFWRDGLVAPAWPGSGLEDFYNGGFYFDWGRSYRQPWSGAGKVDVAGESHMWRLLLGDAPLFANGMQLRQEAGASPAEAVDLCADTVAWWYQSPHRGLVPVAVIAMGDARDRQRHAVVLPAATTCTWLTSTFADPAASPHGASVCRHASGEQSLHVDLANPSQRLRLRRRVDAAQPGQAARILVNGSTAGWFPPVRPDSVHRWQAQDAPLRVAPGSLALEIRIQPLWGQHGDEGVFSASSYTLWATPGERLFVNGFEAATMPAIPASPAPQKATFPSLHHDARQASPR